MEKEAQPCPCRNLRSHDIYFRGGETDASGSYWCVSTQNALGPDGAVVDAQECIFGRACFK